MFPFPRAGQAHASDVPVPVHGGVCSSLLGNCSSSESHARTGRKHRSHCLALPSFYKSLGICTDWALGQDQGGIMELLQCGVTISSSMETLPCRPEEAFPALAGPSKNWRLISPEIIEQEDGNTMCSVQTKEQQYSLTRGMNQGAKEDFVFLPQRFTGNLFER